MQRMMWHTLAAAAVLIPAMGTAHAADAIKWQTNFAKGQAQAKKTHKLMMTDFYAEW